MTPSATLPKSARRMPLRPWLAMTMRSADHCLAASVMVAAGAPDCTNSKVEGCSPSRSRNPAR